MEPYGNPTVLNASITMATVLGMAQQQQSNGACLVAPYRLALPRIPPVAQRPTPKKMFRASKKWCIVCGWRKNEHTHEEGRGGKDKHRNSNCRWNYCGNCFQVLEEHRRLGIGMGPDCTNITSQFCSDNIADWWVYQVSYNCYAFTK
jgi:hypothetical protein